MDIRPVDAKDLPAVGDLLRQLGYVIDAGDLAERIARVSGVHDHRVVVAELDGRVVGLMHVFARPALEKPSEAVVQALVVNKSCRGKGIGQALMHDAEAWAKARALASVVLHTRVDREDARAFYARIGYTTAATSHLMRKTLQP